MALGSGFQMLIIWAFGFRIENAFPLTKSKFFGYSDT